MTALRVLAIVLLLFTLGSTCHGEQKDARPSPAPPASLVVHGATDTRAFVAVIADYGKLHPATAIRYVEMTTQEVYQRAIGTAAPTDPPDLLISSGMDLQTKLVNDGYALPHHLAESAAIPAWARWRDEAFGLTYEPAVLVYNTRLWKPAEVPRTHDQLLSRLRDPSSGLRGRIGTYDVTRSGVGYLLATQDARLNSVAATLTAALGYNDVVLEEQTGPLLDRLAAGELTMAYNLLGSYALARIDAGAPLQMVLLEDYTLVVSRVALIPKSAPHTAEAHRFLDYLLSRRGQNVLARDGRLPAIRSDIDNPLRHPQADSARSDRLRPISLGPGLLVYRDTLKRHAFLEAWTSSIQPFSASK